MSVMSTTYPGYQQSAPSGGEEKEQGEDIQKCGRKMRTFQESFRNVLLEVSFSLPSVPRGNLENI